MSNADFARTQHAMWPVVAEAVDKRMTSLDKFNVDMALTTDGQDVLRETTRSWAGRGETTRALYEVIGEPRRV